MGRKGGEIEGLSRKILRHLAHGEIDLGTLQRGIVYAGEYLKSLGIRDAKITESSTTTNLYGYSDCLETKYDVLIGERRVGGITFIKFPFASKIEFRYFEDFHSYFYDEIPLCRRRKNVIATFVGPTLIGELPNNGFYVEEDKRIFVPFRATNPPGQRRGAIGFLKNGNVRLLTESEKWEAVDSNFVDYSAVIGTSYYFTSEDNGLEAELLGEVDRSTVSYLIFYVDSHGRLVWVYCDIPVQVPRFISQISIGKYMKKLEARSFMAVELEYLGHNITLFDRTKKKVSSHSVGDLGYSRHDCYRVVMK